MRGHPPLRCIIKPDQSWRPDELWRNAVRIFGVYASSWRLKASTYLRYLFSGCAPLDICSLHVHSGLVVRHSCSKPSETPDFEAYSDIEDAYRATTLLEFQKWQRVICKLSSLARNDWVTQWKPHKMVTYAKSDRVVGRVRKNIFQQPKQT